MDDYESDVLPLSFSRLASVSESRFSITSFSPAAWEPDGSPRTATTTTWPINWIVMMQVIKIPLMNYSMMTLRVRDPFVKFVITLGIHAYAWLRCRLDRCRVNKYKSNVKCMNIFSFSQYWSATDVRFLSLYGL